MRFDVVMLIKIALVLITTKYHLFKMRRERADSRSKKNYSPAACGTRITFRERETR